MEFRPRPVVKGYPRCRRTRAPFKNKEPKSGSTVSFEKPQISQKWLATTLDENFADILL